MKNIILTLLSFFFVLAHGQNDPEARKILDDISNEINSYSAFKVNYHYRYEDTKTGDESEEEGVAYLKGNKYKVYLDSYEVYYNGTSIYTYVKGRNEVTILKPSNKDVTFDFTNPRQLFQFWDEDFKFKVVQKETFKGMSLTRIDLFPKTIEKSSYSRIKMLVDPSKNRIHVIKVFSKDGTNFTFTINDINKSIDLSDGEFTFPESEHPDVEVIDMRF